jgi:hypothetical protein
MNSGIATAQGTLFVGWGAIIPGREHTAAQVLGEAMQYLQRLRAEGAIESIDVVLLEPHGGELEGFVLVRGERTKLALLRVDAEFVRTIVAVQLVHAKVAVVGGYSGAAMEGLMQVWGEQEARLLPG